MDPTLLILTAGIGSRYGGIKQLDPVGPHGEYLLDYAIYDAIQAGFGKVVFLITEKIEKEFKRIFSKRYPDSIDIGYAFQELDNIPSGFVVPDSRIKPWGTGHAVMAAKDVIKESFAVANADDYYGPESYMTLYNALKNMENDSKEFLMVGFHVENTLSTCGKVSRGVCNVSGGYLVSVIEREEIHASNGQILFNDQNNEEGVIEPGTLVSMNFWGFAPDTIFPILEEQFEMFLQKSNSVKSSEFYLPFVVDYAVQTKKVSVKVLESTETWFGLTYQEDRALVQENIQKKIEENIYPEKIFPLE